MLKHLVVQIFMAATAIIVVIVFVITVGYPKRLSRIEKINRTVVGILAFVSVTFRFILMLPGEFPYSHYVSVIFDILYITIFSLFVVNTFTRKDYYGKERRH